MRLPPPRPAAAALALVLAPSRGLVAQSPALLALPVPPRVGEVEQLSSRDPAGGNEDWGHFRVVREDGRAVLARSLGPGRIRRIWSADPRGELRIELDGVIVFDGAFAALFDGSTAPFVPPLAGRSGGGCTSWVPLPFLERCEVTIPAPLPIYYQVEIARGPEAERFTANSPRLGRARAELLAPPMASSGEQVVAAAASAVVLEGPGEVLALRARAEFATGADARRAWLRVFVDGAEHACVDGPAALAFGFDPEAGPRRSELAALDTLVTTGIGAADGSRWRELRLPMPFRRRIEVVLDGMPDLRVRWRSGEVGPRRYLHGHLRCARTRRGAPFLALDARGAGHLVGTVLHCAANSGHGLSFLEGDERFVVDGRDAVLGTGTEDYFSGAWYFRGGPFSHPFHAVALLDHDRGRALMARWHLADPIPFASSLRFELEHGGRNDAPGGVYAALVFWYAADLNDRGGGAADRELWLRPPAIPQPTWARAVEIWPRAAHGADRVDVGPDDAVRCPVPWAAVVTLFDTHSAPVARWQVDAGASLRPPASVRDVVHVRFEPLLDAVRTCRIAGPFRPAAPRRGVDERFGPEQDAQHDRNYDDIVGPGPRGWRRLVTDDWTGYFDLNAAVAPNDGVVVYAALTLHAERPCRPRLVLGSDDSVVVLLDGREVHRSVGRRGSVRDQDAVTLDLRAGASTLLLKIEEWDGGFGFHVRLEDAAAVVVDDGLPR